jgi:hypothetical protein
MRVAVKWLKSPIKYGFAKSMGDCSLIDKKKADELHKIDPDLFEVLDKEKPVEVKDTMLKKTHVRPVTRGKKDS